MCSTIALADKCVLMVSDGAIVLGNMEDSKSALVSIFFFCPRSRSRMCRPRQNEISNDIMAKRNTLLT